MSFADYPPRPPRPPAPPPGPPRPPEYPLPGPPIGPPIERQARAILEKAGAEWVTRKIGL